MARPTPLVCLLVAVTLAGCGAGPEDGANGLGPGHHNGDPAGLGVPTWRVGDHWQYEDSMGNTFRLVVSGQSGPDWTVDTDDAMIAFVHDAIAELSYLGAVRASDLAGSQGSDRVRYFDWPLEDGKTWTTRWDGVDLRIEAHDLGNERFHLQAYQGDELRNEYQYSNATRWFDWVRFGAGDDAYRMDLVQSGRDWSGELLRVRAESVLELAGSGPEVDVDTLDFGQPGDADLLLSSLITCTQGAVAFALGPAENIPGIVGLGLEANDDGYNVLGPCPIQEVYFGVLGTQPGEGTWGYSLNLASEDAVYAIQVWLRHFERISV